MSGAIVPEPHKYYSFFPWVTFIVSAERFKPLSSLVRKELGTNPEQPGNLGDWASSHTKKAQVGPHVLLENCILSLHHNQLPKGQMDVSPSELRRHRKASFGVFVCLSHILAFGRRLHNELLL